MVSKCSSCQANWNKPPAAPLHPWNWPTKVWQRIRIDYTGPFMGHMFSLVIDAYSKWPEIFLMSTTTSHRTTQTLRSLLPDQIVSDNGPQFIAEEFKTFCKSNGIRHTTGAPYHPSTNGAIEYAVQTIKKSLKSTANEPGSVPMKLSQFLLSYRTIPHGTTGETPSELFLKRSINTRLDLMKPNKERVNQRQETRIKFHDEINRKTKDFLLGENTLVQNLRSSNPKWITGKIVKKLGPLTYLVQINGQEHKHHIDQLLPLSQQNVEISSSQNNEDFFVPTLPAVSTESQWQNDNTVCCNPPRARKPPDHLT